MKKKKGTQGKQDVPPLIVLPVNRDGLPSFLVERDRWIAWRGEWKTEAGAYSKVPRNPNTGRIAGQAECASPIADAMAYYAKGTAYASGVGFSLPDEGLDDIVFVDLDGAVKMAIQDDGQANLTIETWAELIMSQFPPCYREFSPSGTGIHLIVRGSIPRAVKMVEDHRGFELYSTSRYLAMTGSLIDGSIDDVPFAQEALDYLASQALPKDKTVAIDYQAKSSSYVPAILSSDSDFAWISEAMNQGCLDHAVNDYDPWLAVGMGLHAKFGSSGVDLWDRWSQRSQKYVPGECHKKANGFSAGGSITFATVVKMACDGGARMQSSSRTRMKTSPPGPAMTTKRPDVPAVQSETGFRQSGVGLPEDEYTDLKFADMVIHRFGDRFRFVESWKSWATWDESRGLWILSNVRHFEYFKSFAFDADQYLGSSGKIRAAASLAASDPKVLAAPDQFDAHSDFINLRNGVYDLVNHKMFDHDPMFMATRQADVSYDPASRCPKFLETLELVQPDPAIREFLQRWLGTSLTGRTISEVVINYGDGANGKTTILESCGLVLGTYFAKMPPGFVAKSKGERHPTELVPLYRARFALASENDITDTMDEAKIKIVTGDGEITARRMHENNWSFRPTHKLTIATNHMPSIVGRDSGIWRRMVFVPWSVTIPEEKRRPNYERTIFEEEASGILNWMIEGLRKYQEHGLEIPDRIKSQCAEIQTASDWLSEFIGECLTTKAPRNGIELGMHVRASKVYERFVEWSKARSEKPIASNKFNPILKDKLEKIGVRMTRTSNVPRFHGIRMKEDFDHENEEWNLKPPREPGEDDDEPMPF